MDTSQVNNTCRKRLLDRGSVGVLSIATLVQSDAGGVQVDGGNVFSDGKLQWMRRTGFCEPVGVINRLQPFYSCLFDDGLTVRHAVQLGVQSVAFYRKSVILSNPLFQRQRTNALKQFLKVERLELSQLNENTFCCREAEICLGDGLRIAPEQHTSVLCRYIRAADLGNLKAQGALQTKVTGAAEKISLLHDRYSFYYVRWHTIPHKAA